MRFVHRIARSTTGALLLASVLAPLPSASALAPGDLDGDREIKSVDAALALQVVAGKLAPTAEQQAAADADADGEITLGDARLILTWASQNLGSAPQESFTRDVDLPVLSTATSEVGSLGGTVSLGPGTKLSVPAGAVATYNSVTLSRRDDSQHDPLGNHVAYRIDADPTALAQSTLEVAYSDISASAASTKTVDGVLAIFYDAASRTDQILSVEYRSLAGGLSIPLSFLSESSPAAAALGRAKARNAAGAATLQTSSVYILVADTANLYIDSPVETKILQVPYYRQGQYSYCWACATTMAINYHNLPDDDDHPWVKPWDFVDEMGVSPDAGLSTAAFRFGRRYASFVERKTGATVERCIWPSSTTLELYIKKQILDHERPVVLFLPQYSHYITIVGYEVKGGKTYVYAHDSAGNLNLPIEWSVLIGARWANPKRFIMCTSVIRDAPSGQTPVTIHSLGHRDTTGLVFTSPFNEVAAFPDDADLKFSWLLPSTKTYGFLLNRGRRGDLAADSIPSYYRMQLAARLANGTAAAVSGRLQWKAMKSDATGQTYEGTKDFTIPARADVEVPLVAEAFEALRGSSVVEVEAYRTEAPYSNYDSLRLDVNFDDGIRLSVNQVLGELSWTPYSGSFGQYRVYRKTAVDSAWKLLSIVNSDVTKWTDPDFGRLTGQVFYGVAAHRADPTYSIVLTSDVARVRKTEGTAAFNYGFLDPHSQAPLSGIEFAALATAESWRWPSAADRALTLAGVSPSGLVLALDHDNVGDTDRLLLRDNWGLGPIQDATTHCGLVPGFEPDDLEAGLADDGHAYFTGEREITYHDPFLGEVKARRRHIYRTDGQACTALDLDGSGTLDDADDIASFGIQQLTVSKNGSLVAFEAYSLDQLGVVGTAGGPVRWLSDQCGGDVKVSDDGSRCLFEYYDAQQGKGELATVSTAAGGSVVRLEAMTGLVLTAAYFGISPDGQWVCGMALQYDAEHPEATKLGLALIRADGSDWRWLDTGDIVPQGAPRFTPDGQAVVFPGSGPDSVDPVLGPTTDICKLRIDGTEGVLRLTHTPAVLEWNPYLH